MPEYARYFKQQLLSDCQLVISWPKRDDCCAMDCLSETKVQLGAQQELDVQAEISCGSTCLPAHQ